MPTGVLIFLGIVAICMIGCRRSARRIHRSVRDRHEADARSTQAMSSDLRRMEERLENLETILMDRYSARRRESGADSAVGGRG